MPHSESTMSNNTDAAVGELPELPEADDQRYEWTGPEGKTWVGHSMVFVPAGPINTIDLFTTEQMRAYGQQCWGVGFACGVDAVERPASAWVSLADSDWVNIVNNKTVLDLTEWDAEAAIREAVKLTEARLMVLNAALSAGAQPAAQEPVAVVSPYGATVRLQWASTEAAHNAKPGPLYVSPHPAPQQPLTDAEADRVHSMPWVRDCLLRYVDRPCDMEARDVVRAVVNAVNGLTIGAPQQPDARDALVRELVEAPSTKCGSECDHLCQQPDGFGGCGKRVTQALCSLDTIPTNWELSYGSDDEEESPMWRVHRRQGSRSDREWVLLGTGPTPTAALSKAKESTS